MQHFIKDHKLPLKSSAKVHAKGGVRNSLMKADKYFSELNPDQVMKLYQLYKIDFDMYGYDHTSYLELAQLGLKKENSKVKDSFDLALEQVKKEGKYDQIKTKRKKIAKNQSRKKRKQPKMKKLL